MIELLEALEASPPASILRSSFYLYPLVSALHILSIGALVTSVALMDLRILGLGRAIPVPVVLSHVRPVTVGSLVVALITGVLLLSVRPLDYIVMPVMQWKLVLTGIAIVNAVSFNVLDRDRTGRAAALKGMALASLVLWLTVLLLGRFIGFVE